MISNLSRTPTNLLGGLRAVLTCATTIFFLTSASNHAIAQNMFGKIEINSNKIIVIATPLRNKYALTVIEQLSSDRPCWTELSSDRPVIVQLDLLDFDFTGICGRATDSGGYSIRMADEDVGLDYKLEVLSRDGELFLVGTPYSPNFPELIIGQTHGIAGEPMKIFLNPGWRMTRRTYEGEILGHYYFTHD
jgi:N-acetylmuramoyl-L-alanine amidase